MKYQSKLTAFKWDLLLFVLCGGESFTGIEEQYVEQDEDDIENLVLGLEECGLLLPVLIATRKRQLKDLQINAGYHESVCPSGDPLTQ